MPWAIGVTAGGAAAIACLVATAVSAQSQQRVPTSRPSGILGPADQRAPVSSGTWPWSAIGRVNVVNGPANRGHCTGTLIGAQHIVTAAKRPRYDQIRTEQIRNDWAIVTLANRFELRPIPLLVVRNADLPGATESAEIARAGYSIDRPFALTVHRNCSAKTDSPQPGALQHRCDSMAGDSGSPVLLLKKASDRTIESANIVGIHVTTMQSFESGVGYTARGASGAAASIFEEAVTSALGTQR